MNWQAFGLCVALSASLMVLFVLINYPYYRMSYGEKARGIVVRTVILNLLAICVGWAPAVTLWPDFSIKYALPFVTGLGALGCVSSRFIYPEIIPEELGKSLVQVLERRRQAETGTE